MSTAAHRLSFAPIVIAATAGIWVFAHDVTPARAQDSKPNAVLILDSSRSMWGQIDGVNKVVSTRNVISGLAKDLEGRLNLGIVSYGHRQSTGCGDVQLIMAMGEHKASDVIKTINGIKPKGSTPIAAALKKAAQAARYKEQRASLVLIADGLDNCNANPCDMARELKQDGKDLTIHAIAFDAKQKSKLKSLKCIAENTGGTFASAVSEGELATSLKAAFKVVMAPVMPKIAAAPATDPPPRPVPKSDPPASVSRQQALAPGPQMAEPAAPSTTAKKPPQKGLAVPGESVPVTLSARTVDGGAIIKSGLVWWVYKNSKTKDGKYQLVDTFRDATPTAALPPGAYRIAAAYGKVNLIRDINVERGRALQKTFILNAGGLRLGAVTLNGTTIPPNSVRYDLYADETETDQFGKRKLLLRDAKPGVVLRLNAGAYHVVSTYGDANAVVRADLTVEPGKLTDAVINHSAGKITLKLVNQPGGEALANTQWNILTTGGDIVKESAGALPSHILAAGSYSVLARYQGKNFTREFVVEPGESKQVEVVIQ
ncbi:von Willebrand factor type A domain protein [bacterium BMS3Bbin10]|nr:von Willebrand factor type A domain protein [bacterium BMS3Bbin10]